MKIIKSNEHCPKDYLHWVYNGLDCMITYELRETLDRQLDMTTRRTYRFSLALQAPILEMTLRGIKIDEDELGLLVVKIEDKIHKLENNFNMLCKEGVGIVGKVNWRSPAQLKKLLYDCLGCQPVKKRDSKGTYKNTTDQSAIETIAQRSFMARPFCSHILKLRHYGKQLSFLNTKMDDDSRLRANWHIAGTRTGRMSSSVSDFGTGTNTQNINEEMRVIFIPDKGMKFANIDLEQADSRGLGAVCWNLGAQGLLSAIMDDERLDKPEIYGAYLDACESNDLHTYVCKMVWPELEWADNPRGDRAVANRLFYHDLSYRDCAKRTGHGSNYGGLNALAKTTGIPLKVLKEFQIKYFDKFPCILAWQRWVENQLLIVGSITTLMGRRRQFFGRLKGDSSVLREALAYEPQSITGDVINTGLLKVWRKFSGDVHVLAQVHDSILIQYPQELENDLIPKILEEMRIKIELENGRVCVIPAEAKCGWNWSNFDDKNPKKNPKGLQKFSGMDDREPPKDKGDMLFWDQLGLHPTG